MFANPGILVIGGGIAGQAVCEAVRARAPHVPLTLVCGEVHRPYDRVRLGALLTAEPDVEALRLRPDAWYDDARVRVLAGRRVVALDPEARTALLDDGAVMAFHRAVLCTGSDPLVPPLDGADAGGVHVFRDPSDCGAIVQGARSARRALVIGGGLLGLEAAYALAKLGCPTTVVHLVDRLMERQLDAPAAALLAPAIEGLGVEVRLEHATRAVRTGPDGRVTGLVFADGSELDGDLVVVAVGIRPHVGVARDAGLAVERGVVVDDHLVSSHPNVLAVGECAQHRGVVHGIVAPIQDQAKVAAETLTGGRAAYAGSVPTAKLKVMGVELVYGRRRRGSARGGRRRRRRRDLPQAGHRRRRSRPRCRPARRRARRGAADGRGSPTARGPTTRSGCSPRRRRPPLPSCPTARRCATATASARARSSPPSASSGLGSTQEVVSVTRAGSGCGSCKPVVTELLSLERGRRRRGAGLPLPLPPPDARRARRARARARDHLRRRAVGRVRSRPQLRRLQAGARLPRLRAPGRPLPRGAPRALHQRPRAREHPARRHVQRRAADPRRRCRPRTSCAASPTWPTSTSCRW